MEDILKSLRAEGYQPEETDDNNFEPITGKYVCRIDGISRINGVSEKTGNKYDFRSMNLQVVEVIDGDKATNRFLKINYTSNAKGMKKLLNDMFTAGIEVNAQSDEELDEFLLTLKDKTVNVRCWVWTPENDREGNPIPEENRRSLQQIRIVKELKSKKSGSSTGSNVPF